MGHGPERGLFVVVILFLMVFHVLPMSPDMELSCHASLQV